MPGIPFPEEVSLTISFQSANEFSDFADGLIHKKTVPYTIILQPLLGWYTVSCCGKTIHAVPGETVLIPSNTEVTFIHHGSKAKPMSARWLHIACLIFGAIDLTSLFTIPLSVRGKPSQIIGSIIGELIHLSEDLSVYAALRRKELGFAALGCMIQCSLPREDRGGFINRAQRFEPVINYMTKHLEDALSVKDLAKAAFLSPSRFYSMFKNTMSVSPMTYFRRLRVAKASNILLMTSHPISQVAAECGFVNQFHFSRIFKEITGLNPREYRKQSLVF
jgi:AraC-like DNA-binding protein